MPGYVGGYCAGLGLSERSMTKYLAIPTFLALLLLACPAVRAEGDKAPCGSFHKLADGKWSVVKQVKIAHGNTNTMLNPGTAIGPGTRIAGVDIYAALEKSCR